MEKINRTKVGVVVSDKMDKTVVVQIREQKRHAKYKKIYTEYRKFKAHDPNNEYHVGDKVEISETRPISKTVHFRVVGKVK